MLDKIIEKRNTRKLYCEIKNTFWDFSIFLIIRNSYNFLMDDL